MLERPKSLLEMMDATTVVVFIKVGVESPSTTKVLVVSPTTNKVAVVSPSTNLQKFVSFLSARQPPSTRCDTSSSGFCKNFTDCFHFCFW